MCRAWSGRETHFDARGTRFRIRMPLTLKTRHGPVRYKEVNGRQGPGRYCIYRLRDRLTTACVLAHSFESRATRGLGRRAHTSRDGREIRDSALAPHEPRRDVRDEIRRVTRPRHPANADPTSRRGLLKDCSPSFLKRGHRRVFERIGHRPDECLPRVLNRHALL